MSESTSGPDLFNMLADEFAERYRRGERPLPQRVHREIPGARRADRRAVPGPGRDGTVRQRGRPGDRAASAARPGTAGPIPERLGDYRILREIARGGMGIVYEAVQESLGRHVALKVLPQHRLADPNQLERFQREARAAAMLHHTNIVPVFGVGEHDGVHYYAMQYIQGQGLDAVLAEVKRLRGSNPREPAPSSVPGDDPGWRPAWRSSWCPGGSQARAAAPAETVSADGIAPAGSRQGFGDDLRGAGPGPALSASAILGQSGSPYYRSVARLGVQAAEALAYAHHHKLLHRDIKPSNLLLDLQGTIWVTDFGLVKAEGTDAPDPNRRHRGHTAVHGSRAVPRPGRCAFDVYALGLTLYEMLTLEPAFAADQRSCSIDKILHEEPAKPRQIDPRIPRDLETIALKAIAKEPSDRYRTAVRTGRGPAAVPGRPADPGAAGSALEQAGGGAAATRSVAGARSPRWPRPSWPWRCCPSSTPTGRQRRPGESRLTVLGGAIPRRDRWPNRTGSWRSATSSAARPPSRRTRSARACSGWSRAGGRRSRPATRPGSTPPGPTWPPGSLITPDSRRSFPTKVPSTPPPSAPTARPSSPGGDDRTARLWDAATGQPIGQPMRHEARSGAVAFSPDGKTVLTGCTDRTARLWDAATGQPVGSPSRMGARSSAVAYQPRRQDHPHRERGQDGATLGRRHRSAHRSALRASGALSDAVAFSPDGKSILTGSGTDGAALGRRHRPAHRLSPSSIERHVRAVAFSPDGKTVLTGAATARRSSWDAATGKPVGEPIRHRVRVRAVAFSPDGRTVLTGSEDKTARLWDAVTNQPIGPPLVHQGPVVAVAFSPDGKSFLTASSDSTVRLWDADPGQPFGLILDHQDVGPKRGLQPRWQVDLQRNRDGTVRRWDAATGEIIGPTMRPSRRVVAVAVSPDGTTLLTGSNDKTARLWDTATGKPIGPPLQHESQVNVVAFCSDGKTIMTGSEDRTVRLWDALTGTPLGQPIPQSELGRCRGVQPRRQVLCRRLLPMARHRCGTWRPGRRSASRSRIPGASVPRRSARTARPS